MSVCVKEALPTRTGVCEATAWDMVLRKSVIIGYCCLILSHVSSSASLMHALVTLQKAEFGPAMTGMKWYSNRNCFPLWWCCSYAKGAHYWRICAPGLWPSPHPLRGIARCLGFWYIYWVEMQYKEFCSHKEIFLLEVSNATEGWGAFGNTKI